MEVDVERCRNRYPARMAPQIRPAGRSPAALYINVFKYFFLVSGSSRTGYWVDVTFQEAMAIELNVVKSAL